MIDPAPIVAGCQTVNCSDVRRPFGRLEWVFILTRSGCAYCRGEGHTIDLPPGSLLALRPGIPHDYGSVGAWENIWVHVHLRKSWGQLMAWPEKITGCFLLLLSPSIRKNVETAFLDMEALQHADEHPHRMDLAMNALERALLYASPPPELQQETATPDPRIRKAIELLRLEYQRPPGLTEMARLCGLSRSRFAELFHAETHLTTGEFLENQRRRRALHLLQYTRMSVTQIAEQLGYSSPFHFSARFKQALGLSPRTYRTGLHKVKSGR